MNIIDLISQDVTLTKRGKEHVGLCPFHAEKTPSFAVNAERGMYYCHACHEGGDIISYLRKAKGKSFREAAALAGKELPETNRERDARERAVKAHLLTQYWRWYHVQLKEWTDLFQHLTAELDMAEIGYRATIRRPDLYTETEKTYWGQRRAHLSDVLAVVEHTCDVLTYDAHERERFAWWQSVRS